MDVVVTLMNPKTQLIGDIFTNSFLGLRITSQKFGEVML